MAVHTTTTGTSVTATIVGVVTLLLGASGVFGQLEDAMNTIWDVEANKGGGLLAMVKDRFLSFTMVLGTCFLLLVSLLVSTILTAAVRSISRGSEVTILLQVLDFIVSLGSITALFALLFRFLPHKRIAWHDVWLGSFLTATLFVIGKIALGSYLGRPGAMAGYGAAGSLILILLWVYYASQIFFFGAEVTRAVEEHHATREDF